MSLTVCFLTRNEEASIGRAIRSVAGLADEVVVADTASSDRTVEVAAGLGARVHQFPWEEDFAVGRNFTLGQATGDWVLWMNASEELLPASHAHLRGCLDRADAFGYFVLVQTPLGGDRAGEFAEAADLRLFRRRPDLRFVGRLHPAVAPELVEAVRREGQLVLPSAVTLRGTVDAAPRSESKLRWTARLLELELRDRPGQLHYLIEHGRTLLLLNDPRGHAVLAEAAEQVLAARDAPAPPAMKVQLLLEYLLKAPPQRVQARLTREQARVLALRWFPASPPLLYTIAQLSFEEGQYRLAAHLLERLVELGRTGGYDRSRAFDPALVGEEALVNLGACYRRLGEPERAEPCYRELLASKRFGAQAAQALAEMQRGGPTA